MQQWEARVYLPLDGTQEAGGPHVAAVLGLQGAQSEREGGHAEGSVSRGKRPAWISPLNC